MCSATAAFMRVFCPEWGARSVCNPADDGVVSGSRINFVCCAFAQFIVSFSTYLTCQFSYAL
jgi:hypothetical protein